MVERSVTVRPATDDDRDRIATLLRHNELPVSDLAESPVRLFVGVGGEAVLAVGGYEKYGTDGLLRSIVVPAEKRDSGYGATLCAQLATRAANAGVERLFLLTTTASDFFRRQGYEPVARSAVPEPIRRTTQFSVLCPDSATCLWRPLE